MNTPLADRIRPKSIDDMVGQQHLIGKGMMLRNIIESGKIPNMIFYGPSGIGKTTLATIIAENAGMTLRKLNGTSAGTADIREIIAETGTISGVNGILLYLDEIQYLNKKQQQALLQYIEDGSITLIASTTENPYFYVYGAVLSRCTAFEFKPITAADTVPAIERAFRIISEDIPELEIAPDTISTIASRCGGDVRKAMNAVELCAYGAPEQDGRRIITAELAAELSQRSGMKYDREGDEHYDIISAYHKSMRGSDPDAAIHYLARLLEAGDLASACRRLLCCACEDVGLAYPQIIPIVKAAVDTAQMIGLPEAQLPLADAVILVSTAPKSNSAYLAIAAATADIKSGKTGSIPRQLQNKHLDGADVKVKGQFYKYPHDYPNHYVAQQYLPDELKDAKYYKYGANKTEQAFNDYLSNLKHKAEPTESAVKGQRPKNIY